MGGICQENDESEPSQSMIFFLSGKGTAFDGDPPIRKTYSSEQSCLPVAIPVSILVECLR